MCKVDTLPGAEHESTILEGDAQLGRSQHGLDMCRHVIRSLQSVGIKRITFRHQPVQPLLKVVAGTVVVVLLNKQ